MTEFDLPRIAAHVRSAVDAAALDVAPGAHAVIDDLLPADLYATLLSTMPPEDGFDRADRFKSNFDPFSTTIAPARSVDTWQAFETGVIGGLLGPLLVAKFRSALDVMYANLFGPLAADACALDQHASRGRLMLRRPGYRLTPHRDNKAIAITGLIYFARPGDSEDYGTSLYRVEHDQEAPSSKTFYPEEFGATTTLARAVPFKANSALVFANAAGMAHGAAIPREATQLQRYAYQFYIGPLKRDLSALLARLPESSRVRWVGLPGIRASSDSHGTS